MSNNKTNPNDIAFACVEEEGLTKREYFAAMAMQGILANPNRKSWDEYNPNNAIEIADELIKALNSGQQ